MRQSTSSGQVRNQVLPEKNTLGELFKDQDSNENEIQNKDW